MSSSRLSRALVVVMGSLASVVLLAGCLRFTADLSVNESDQVSGSIVVAFPQELVGLVDDDPELSGWQKRYETLPGVTTRGFDQDGRIGNEVVLRDVPISDFSTAGSGRAPIRIVRSGDELLISGEFDFSRFDGEGDAEEPVVQASFSLFSSPDMRVSITVPGHILSTNGTVDDDTNTINWRLRLGSQNTLEARVLSPEPASFSLGSNGALLIGGVGVVVGVVVGLTFVAISRKRQTPIA
jgi:hypothetical protein